MDKLINYLLSAIPLGMTFLYGSTGEIITEKAGHLNLGIPGIMCVGAAGGCLALQLMSVNAALPGVLVVIIALLASFLCAAMMGLIYSFLTVSLHANQNVTGLALTTFGVGTMKFIMSKITVMAAETETRYLYAIKYFRFPFAESTTLKYCGIMVFLAIAIAIVTSYVLNRTRVGLHLRAVGENPATADAMGINVTAYKYVATLIGSGIAGLGGLFYGCLAVFLRRCGLCSGVLSSGASPTAAVFFLSTRALGASRHLFFRPFALYRLYLNYICYLFSR